MKRAQRTAYQTNSAFKKSFGGLGGIVKAGFAGVISGLSIGLITQGVKSALEYAGSLAEVSQQLGVTTKDLQVFRYAAGQVGVSQEQLETGLSKLTITLGKVAAGAKAPAAALNAIGISAAQIKGKDTGEAFRIIADGLEKVTDRSQRAAVEVALFGKSGAMLDNLLSGGSRAVNELAAAADELGIVLSDEQIQKADQTADKLEALQTVLKASIAKDVADNADSILDFANALFQLVNAANQAREAIANFERNYNLPNLIKGAAFGKGVAGKSVTTDLSMGGSAAAIAEKMGLKVAGSGGAGGGADVGKFLAGGGGGRSKKDDAERKRQEALRAAYQFDQELLRAQQDVLRAQQSLATDYSERAAIAIQLLNLDQQGFQREMEYAVASGDLSKAQAAQLQAEYDKKDALERQAVIAEEEAQRLEDYNNLDQLDFDLKRAKLESEAQLAETASERRDVELRLLELGYRQERARLEAILADEKSSWAAKEEARRRLLSLNQTEANDKQDVINSTRGPMEDYLASLPTTAAKAQEALEQLQVQGFEGLIDAAVALTEGFSSAKDALLSTLKQFLQGLLRMQLQKGLGSILGGGGMNFGSLFGGGSSPSFSGLASGNISSLNSIPMNIPGFASGGSGVFGGFAGIDRNILSMNGLPIAKVSRGESFAIGANGGSGGNTQIFNVYANDADSFRRSERQIARDARRRLAV